MTHGSLLEGDSLLLTHGRDDGNEDLESRAKSQLRCSQQGGATHIHSVVESGRDLLSNLSLGDLDVVLGSSVHGHHVEESIVNCERRERSASERKKEGRRTNR